MWARSSSFSCVCLLAGRLLCEREAVDVGGTSMLFLSALGLPVVVNIFREKRMTLQKKTKTKKLTKTGTFGH